MATISYDPIKDRLAGYIRNSRVLRKLFYTGLDLLFLRSWHVRRILRREGARLEKKGSWNVLDAGCGFGQYDHFILNRFDHVRVLSVDVKEEYLDDCRGFFTKEILSGRIRFEQTDLLRMNKEHEFDFILCVDVLEHIREDHVVLKNLAKSLKPGGQILIHSPSHYSEDDAGDEQSFVGEHARTGYSKQDIREKFIQAGLTPDRLHYTYGPFGRPAWVLSVKYPMLLLNKAGMAGLPLLLIYYPVVLPVCLVMNFLDLYTGNSKGTGIYALGNRHADS